MNVVNWRFVLLTDWISTISITRAYDRDFNIAIEMQKYEPAYYILIFERRHYIFVVKTVRKYELALYKHTAI